MTVKLDLTPEQEAEAAQQAQENGLALDDYLQQQLQRTITGASAAQPRYDREAALRLLDELETNHEKYGTPEEQREALEYLEKAIDADRPGQRRIFGKGYNPA